VATATARKIFALTMSDEKWYCPHPFKHAFVDSSGISCCCQIIRQNVSLEDWATNKDLIRIQKETLAGVVPKECSVCKQIEQSGMISLRQTACKDYDDVVFDQLDIDFVDYRYSNICNFKCRSCSPQFSHRIQQELSGHESLQKFYNYAITSKVVSVNHKNIVWIRDNIKQIKRMMFTGGEPTVIPEVRSIIQDILEDPTIETKLLITTNCSFTDRFWYDLVDKLPNRLHWTVSLDSTDQHSEIIRHGTVWSAVKKNIEWLSINSESLDINTVISSMNIFQLKPLLRFVRRCQYQSMLPTGKHGSEGIRHQFFISTDPKLSAVNWPPEMRSKVIEYLKSCESLDIDSRQHEMLRSLQTQIENHVFNHAHWNFSKEFHETLDFLRNENHDDLFTPQS